MRRNNFETYFGLAIALWGALCSGAFAGVLAVLLQIGFFKSVGVFAVSGFISGGIVSLFVVRRYRNRGLAGLQDSGRRWGALGGLINAMLSATVVLALITRASDVQVHDSMWEELAAVLGFGLGLGGIYGLLFGLLPGGICGILFEAGVTKYWLNRLPSDK